MRSHGPAESAIDVPGSARGRRRQQQIEPLEELSQGLAVLQPTPQQATVMIGAEGTKIFDGGQQRRNRKQEVQLGVGESYAVAAGRPHLVTNAGDTSMTILVLQGVGEYDYVPLV